MRERLQEQWHWSQWELIGVGNEQGAVVIDAIEVSAQEGRASDRLLTMVLAAADPPDALTIELTRTLEQWAASDTVCDVLQQVDDPETLVLFQDSQLLVFGVPE